MRAWVLAHSYNLIVGAIAGIAGYFAPVQNVVLVVVMAILLDCLTGVWASAKRGKGIKSRRLLRTFYKIGLATIVIYLLYSMDKEMGVIELHKIVAWVIAGFEVWSILENATKITDHRIFRLLRRFMEDRIEQNTGIKIDEKESNK